MDYQIDNQIIIKTLQAEVLNLNKTIEKLNFDNKQNIDLYIKEKATNKIVFDQLESSKLEVNILKGEIIRIRCSKRTQDCFDSTLEDLLQSKNKVEAELSKL